MVSQAEAQVFASQYVASHFRDSIRGRQQVIGDTVAELAVVCYNAIMAAPQNATRQAALEIGVKAAERYFEMTKTRREIIQILGVANQTVYGEVPSQWLRSRH